MKDQRLLTKRTFVKTAFYGVHDVDVAAPRMPVSPLAADQLYRSTDQLDRAHDSCYGASAPGQQGIGLLENPFEGFSANPGQ